MADSISIIIPCFNAEKTLPLLLDSLQNQLTATDEILLVDDDSTDRSKGIALERGITVFSTGGRKGPAVARNLGAEKAGGDVLLFLDSDVIAPDHLMKHLRERFASDSDLSALSGMYALQPANDRFFHHVKAAQCYAWFEGKTQFESFETACAAIRTDEFNRAGCFDETYSGADVEDFEFGYRLGRPIELDHRMSVQHHFPDFYTNLKNFYKRSYLWTKLFRQRKRFDSAATTSSEAIYTLLAPTALILILIAMIPLLHFAFWGAVILMLLWIFSKWKIVKLLQRKFGPIKSLLSLPYLFIGDLAAFAGAVAGYFSFEKR